MNRGAVALPGGGAVVVALVVVVRVLSHGAELVHDLNPIKYSVEHIVPKAQKFVDEGGANELFVNYLCSTVTGGVNQRPPGETVGEFIESEISERAIHVSATLPQEKLDQFEAALQISQWNSATAAKYVQVCGRTGFPHE